MTKLRGILAIDQGTTSSRAMVFDEQARLVASAQKEFQQYFPADGWVEHDPEEIWASVLSTAREALSQAESAGVEVKSIGITNQRETTLVWNNKTGECIYPAIVWQDRRTADFCHQLDKQSVDQIRRKTGLVVDPYFSASKIRWILDNVEGARESEKRGELSFGTIDSFLIHKLTGRQQHLTDATNASRTSLFNINSQTWDPELCALFDVPLSLLPEVKDCSDDFGMTEAELFNKEIPIQGVAGDQHAATIGQCCFAAGDLKSTYGTGCFLLVNTGSKRIDSSNRLLTTIAYRLEGQVTYALEGSIFIAGAAIQWLRDGLQIIKRAEDTEALAMSASPDSRVYLVPAFTGLGAPYWSSEARGLICGLTRDSGPAEIAKAALEAVSYQTYDLLEAIERDGITIKELKIDGGMVDNNWFCQHLADTLQASVKRPDIKETTAIGAAFLAGLKAGIFESLEELSATWRDKGAFEPEENEKREANIQQWKIAVARALY